MRHPSSAPPQRQAVILLVVVSMLALFAVVGISFVLYAESEATASRIFRESQTPPQQPDIDPVTLLNAALSQLIYDVPDTDANVGVYSSLRGHSLARNMYGWNAAGTNASTNGNVVPFNGVGRLKYPVAQPSLPISGLEDYRLINYKVFRGDGFIRDPEHYSSTIAYRTSPTAALNQPYAGGFNPPYSYPDANFMALGAMQPGPVPPTPGPTQIPGGSILARSFHRDWLFNYNYVPGNPSAPPYQNLLNDPNHPNWTSPYGKYLTLRPRPIDNAGFPYPVSPGGDVQNLLGGPGFTYIDPATGQRKNALEDSIWVDLGYPAQQAANGQWFKPLFAFLILDLDNRLNLNVHGNVRLAGSTGTFDHTSQFGIGKHEVSLKQVLNADSATNPTEWINVFLGNREATSPFTQYAGRYVTPPAAPNPLRTPGQGPGSAYPQPTSPPLPPTTPAATFAAYGSLPQSSLLSLKGPPKYSNFNLDAALETTGSSYPNYFYQQAGIYGFPKTGTFHASPDFTNAPASGYSNGMPNTPPNPEAYQHPLIFNPLKPLAQANKVFSASNMQYLMGRYKYYDNNLTVSRSELYPLLSTNLDDTGASFSIAGVDSWRVRQLLTTTSFDVDRPGVMPSAYDPTTGTPNGAPYQLVSGNHYPSVDTTKAGAKFPGVPTDLNSTTVPAGSDFANNDWRAASAQLFDRLDLAARLPDYPPPDSNGKIDLTNPTSATSIQFAQAQGARHRMAQQIFSRLLAATGASAPSNTAGPEYDATRWLAQLAVNMVDYIDNDDYSTPFHWNTNPASGDSGYVYGTELPRLVLNEAYAEMTNDPTDTGLTPPPTQPQKATKNFHVNFWLELANPLAAGSDPALTEGGNARLQVTGTTTGSYRIEIVDSTAVSQPQFLLPSNVTGDPQVTPLLTVDDFTRDPADGPPPATVTDPFVVLPSDKGSTLAAAIPTNTGYYVLGPKEDFNTNLPPPATGPSMSGGPSSFKDKPTLKVWDQGGAKPKNSLTYSGLANTTSDQPPPSYAVLLRRLACPAIPPQPNPAQANYNPYITVDYIDTLQSNDAVQALQSAPNTTNYKTVTQRVSYGRKQPYDTKAIIPQNPTQPPVPPNPPGANEPQNTFFNANTNPPLTPGSPPPPYDWLVHLDRKPISLGEMLMVSAYKPHELTHKFIAMGTPTSVPAGHLAPWFDLDMTSNPPTQLPAGQSARLFRALEFFGVRERTVDMAAGARVPGKININTVWDGSILQALADPQPGNFFTSTYITGTQTIYDPTNPLNANSLWGQIVQQRSPNGLVNGPYASGTTQGDRPFLSLGAPAANNDTQYVNEWGDANSNVGIGSTYLRPKPAPNNTQHLFQMPGTGNPGPTPPPTPPTQPHPYLQQELLTKIGSHLTTRSNVFAVYLTVGFFEVVKEYDTSGNPLLPDKLGEEIGSSAKTGGPNKVLRHRMFAVVDRTGLALDPQNYLEQAHAESPTLRRPFFYMAQQTVSDSMNVAGGQFNPNGDPATDSNSNPLIDLEIPSQNPPQAPNGTQPQYYTVRIPADGGSSTQLQGTYDGFPWTLSSSDTLYLGTGANQHLGKIVPPMVYDSNAKMGIINFQVVPPPSGVPFQPLPPGFLISNVQLGNPGPQPSFSFLNGRYAPVVPAVTIWE